MSFSGEEQNFWLRKSYTHSTPVCSIVFDEEKLKWMKSVPSGWSIHGLYERCLGSQSLRVFCEGLAHLGYTYEGIPPRFFAPIITDWSGAKFSKSLYVASRTYDALPKGFLDFSQFQATYGEKGLDLLWEEVQTWVSDPKRLLRNYSVEYFKMLLSTL